MHAAGVGADRQRDFLGHHFQVADGEPAVAPPDIDDGRAAAIIGARHAHEVGLPEAGLHRLDPVAPVRVAAAGIRPEAAVAVVPVLDVEGAVAPALDVACRARAVAIHHLVDRAARVAIEQADAHGLFPAVGAAARHRQAAAGAMHAGDRLHVAAHQRVALDAPAVRRDEEFAAVVAGQAAPHA